jgi:hypothetical protein
LLEKKDLSMKFKSTIVALLIGLSLIGAACSKSGGSAANMSDDDKHKLFQAAGVTQDPSLIVQVTQKLGLSDSSGQPTSAFQDFTKAHYEWATKNAQWITENSTPEKGKAYVNSHMP